MNIFEFFGDKKLNKFLIIGDDDKDYDDILKLKNILKKSRISLIDLNFVENLVKKVKPRTRISTELNSFTKSFKTPRNRAKCISKVILKGDKKLKKISISTRKKMEKDILINRVEDPNSFIKKYIPEAKNSIIKSSRGKFKINNIFEVISKKQEKSFNNNEIKESALLFHGSRTENFFWILKNNLKKGRKGMFGGGIYLADEFSKSAQYSDCGRFVKKGSIGYVAAFEVNISNVKEIKNGRNDDRLKSLKEKTHIIKALKGKTLLSNEYIVYKNKGLTKIKYLIEIERIK